MSQTTKIHNISNNNLSIIINWEDGEKSVFHYLWLRDNCPSEIHPTARERLFNIISVSKFLMHFLIGCLKVLSF